MCCDNQSAINVINARVPTERSRHIDVQHLAAQDWKESGAIAMEFISGIINPSDDLTKPLGWVSHDRHARRIMGHCQLVFVLFLFDLLKTSACVRSVTHLFVQFQLFLDFLSILPPAIASTLTTHLVPTILHDVVFLWHVKVRPGCCVVVEPCTTDVSDWTKIDSPRGGHRLHCG